MDLGSRILAWLQVKDMTQRQLAAAVDVSPAAVTAWIKGDSDPTNRNLIAVADALGVSMERFYGRVPRARTA